MCSGRGVPRRPLRALSAREVEQRSARAGKAPANEAPLQHVCAEMRRLQLAGHTPRRAPQRPDRDAHAPASRLKQRAPLPPFTVYQDDGAHGPEPVPFCIHTRAMRAAEAEAEKENRAV
ncbi:hypothetical protein MVES1_003636 [Malassezia vespertilionis]|uniref:uncharacterized protein n=1 Tax=Malassezia vespertilionis TaxID=2020962 RepID=UPI0024B2712E|nr:uncharacterized protein MVES1_003636 [Malassezia vespertilionis]WFD08264.1 hypothetical protein MVES1_003636 [Malassezia vespertilionis]